MAENIFKLRIDSQEYDAKLKRASDGLLKYVEDARKAGTSLTQASESANAFVKELANVPTVAKATKSALREYTQSLADMTSVYRQLSEDEKTSDFGRALAESINQLTEKAGKAKDTMADIQASIANAASDTRRFDQIAAGAQLMTSSFQTLQGAAKLLGVELGDNVEVLAKLQAAMSITQGLQQLQNLLQKQSALMQGINALQKEFNLLAKANPYVLLASAIAAVAAGYALWELNGKKAKQIQKELNGELEVTKVKLKQIDQDTDFSVGIAEAAGKSWRAIHELRLEAARTKLQLADLNYDKIVSSGGTAEQMKEALALSNEAWQGVMKVLNEGTKHEVMMRNAGRSGRGGGGRSGGSSITTQTAPYGLIDVNEHQQSQIREKIKHAGSIDEIQRLQEELQKLEREHDVLMGKTFEAGELLEVMVTAPLPPMMKMKETLKELNEQLDKAKSPEEYQSILSDIKAVQQEIDAFSGKASLPKNTTDEWNKAASAIQSVGQALQSIEDPAAKVVGIIAQAIATIALTFAQSLKGTVTPWDWIAGAAAGTATMIATISAIKSATSGTYAEGGIIKGKHYSGDNIPADSFVNAGELVLNRAQQSTLASQLNGGGIGNMTLTAVVSGEQIRMVLNNNGRRTGRGEYVTTKFM